MAKPILFDSISRNKFNNLTDEQKAKKNFLIKDENGISKYIGSLENGGSSNNELIVVYTEGQDNRYIPTRADGETPITFAEIMEAIDDGFQVSAEIRGKDGIIMKINNMMIVPNMAINFVFSMVVDSSSGGLAALSHSVEDEAVLMTVLISNE